MATTATLTGTFTLPNNAAPESAVLSVTLSAMDTDQNTGHVLPDDGLFTVALVAGEIPAGQTIWQNTAGLRGTHYRATLAWTASDGRLLSRYLGSFQVGEEAEYDMADLLDQPPIATLPEGWYSTLTQAQYDAAITARDEATEARDQIFADGGVVSLDGIQTLTNKTMTSLLMTGAPRASGLTADGRAQFVADLEVLPTPFADRATAAAATIPLVQQVTSYRGPNGSILQFVRDASGTALTTADGGTWSPLGEATPEHWADSPTYSQLNAAMQWAIDNSRRFVARRVYSLADGFTLYLRGELLFDTRGSIMQAEKNVYPTTRLDMIRVDSGGDGSSGWTLDWTVGILDGTWMPFPGEGHSRYLLNISNNAAAYVRRFSVEGFRTGDHWLDFPVDDIGRVCGGDSHLFYASPKGHVDVGLAVGAKDISVYISSPSGLSGARYGMVTFDVKAMNCRRCVQAKRGYHQWSGHLTAYNCEEGVGFSQASMDGPDQSGWGGIITVDARNCRWAVCDREGSNVTYIVNSYDIGAYLAESSVGAGDGFVSADAAAFRGLGTTNTTAYVNTHGVNPALTALGGYTAANFRAITLKDSGTSKAARGNLFHLHASNMGRLFVEFAADDPADNPDSNIVSYRSRNISSGNITLGADTQLVQIGHNKAPSGTVAAPGIGFGSGDAGFYRTGSNELGAATGGVSGWLLSSTGLQINLPVTGAAVMAGKTDLTPDLVMLNGAHGLGILRDVNNTHDVQTIAPGFVGNASASSVPANVPVAGAYRWIGQKHVKDSQTASLLYHRPDGNMLYIQSNSGGVWSDWSRLYGWNNILGAVSLSGGVPTGRLFEYNSNANGRYLRLPDGTQICWQTVTVNLAISTAFLGGFRSTGQTWTFPAAFSAAPALSGSSPDQTTLAPVFGTTGATASNWNAVAFTSQSAADRTVTLMAIGRWP